jgi:hypothetical protein
MYHFVLRFLQRTLETPKPLGRWGYHFETQIRYQKYYE